MKYDVHIYAVVRVKVSDVEAHSQREAIKKAKEEEDLWGRFDGKDQEYAEEITDYLVDEVGDKEYRKSRWYTSHGNARQFRRSEQVE